MILLLRMSQVPGKGYDAILFAGIALVAGCILQGKFSALWVLIAGEEPCIVPTLSCDRAWQP